MVTSHAASLVPVACRRTAYVTLRSAAVTFLIKLVGVFPSVVAKKGFLFSVLISSFKNLFIDCNVNNEKLMSDNFVSIFRQKGFYAVCCRCNVISK